MKDIRLALSLMLFCWAAVTTQHKIVVYWGQNGSRQEADLAEYCKQSSPYDVIVIAFISVFVRPPNKNYPKLDLSRHCGWGPNPDYVDLYKCSSLVTDPMLECQRNGKTLQLSLGGATYTYGLTTDQVDMFAANLWNLFLGGSETPLLRPFGDVVLNGINFDIETFQNDDAFSKLVEKLHQYMSADSSKKYVMSAAPQCPFPDKYFGNVLQKQGNYIDEIYVQFYNNYCHPAGDFFNATLEQWMTMSKDFAKMKIYVGLLAYPNATYDQKQYLAPDKVKVLYKSLQSMERFGGFMIWDASWDEKSKVDNKRFTDHLKDLMNAIQPTIPTMMTTTTTTEKTESKLTSTITKASSTTTTTPEPLPPIQQTIPPTTMTTEKTESKLTSTITKASTTTTTTPEPLPPLKIVGEWGQNEVSNAKSDEQSLSYYCNHNSYDIIIIKAVIIFFDDGGMTGGNLPGVLFSKHCYLTFDSRHPNLLNCEAIANDIRFCQQRGKQILLSIGNGVRWNGFATPKEAKLFANNLWNIFLGGSFLMRTFGSVKLNGINLAISSFSKRDFFDEFLVELRQLMNTDNATKYLITATSSCFFPNLQLGDTFQRSSRLLDAFLLSFTEQSCEPHNLADFETALNSWLNLPGPNVYLGFETTKLIQWKAKYFIEREKAIEIYKTYAKKYPRVIGISVSDIGYDGISQIDGITYSDYIKKVFYPDLYTTLPPPITNAPPPRRCYGLLCAGLLWKPSIELIVTLLLVGACKLVF